MSGHEGRVQGGWGTDEHLPVVNGIGVLDEIECRTKAGVLHVEEVTSVAILELLDGLRVLAGIALGGRVRTKNETRLKW